MQYSIEFVKDKNRFVLKTSGSLTMLGIQDMVRDLVSHEDWQKGRDLFIDHRDASFDKISVDDIIILSQTVKTLDQTLGARHCAVVNSDDSHLKNSMYDVKIEAEVDLVNRNFFPDQYDEALQWLDDNM